jgi:hypothetical protein
VLEALLPHTTAEQFDLADGLGYSAAQVQQPVPVTCGAGMAAMTLTAAGFPTPAPTQSGPFWWARATV